MTIKDHPQHLYLEVVEAWLPGMSDVAIVDWTGTNPVPDRAGWTNPDEFTTRWEWDTDLTAQEEADFDAIIDRLMGGGTGMPTDAKVDELVATMKAWRNRGGTPTDAQRDAATDAVIDYLRYLRLLV